MRTHSHEELRELAEHSNVPVINGLDELYHPCQALADLQTIEEQRGSLPGQTVAYVGDGNNVAHSLMIASLMSGVSMKVITPSGYEPDADATQRARAAARHGATLEVTRDLGAVEGVDVVYTDVWTSMGQETESRLRLKAFAGFEVNDAMMARAKPDALFMHCLPAHRGEEVAASVIDGLSRLSTIRQKIGSMRRRLSWSFWRILCVQLLAQEPMPHCDYRGVFLC